MLRKQTTLEARRSRMLRLGGGWTGLISLASMAVFMGLQCPPAVELAASAGADKAVTVGQVVTATGTATGGNAPYSFAWTQTSGVVVGLDGADSASVAVTGLTAGSAVLTLTVTDVAGASATDTVTVTVNAIPDPAAPTVSAAAGDDTLDIGQATSLTATITGGQAPITVSWAQTSGPGQALSAADSAVASVTGTAAGTAEFQVTVTDALGRSASDDVSVTVAAAASTLAVTASAAASNVALPSGGTLSAAVTGGTQPYTFAWLQTSGTAALLGNAAGQSTAVAFFTAGAYTFTVTVTDAVGGTVTSSAVTVTVTGVIPLVFTLNTDLLVGSSGDDTFTAGLSGGANTLQTGDSGDGEGGNDTLNLFLAAAATGFSLSDIETINVLATAAAAVNFANVTGVTALNSSNSTAALTVNNLQSIPAISVNATDQNHTFTFAAGATGGAADDVAVALSDVTAGALAITGAVEAITLNSSGGNDNVLAALTSPATVETLNVGGDTALEVTAALANEITTVDASGNSGGIDIILGTGDVTVTGGSGDDTLTFNAGEFDDNDTVDGGAGDDLLEADSDDVTTTAFPAAATNVTAIETLGITDASNDTINATFFGVSTVRLEAGAAAGLDLTLASGNSVVVEANSAGAQTYRVAGTATTDSMTLTLDDADLGGAQTFAGLETVNLVSETAANTTVGLTITPSAGVATGALVISGDQDLTIGATNANPVNASALTGDLTMSAGPTAAASITGGTGDDTLVGSASADSINGGEGDDTIDAAAGADAVNGGAGDDVIEGGAAGDSLTGGADADSFDYTTATDSLNTALDTLNDFTSGTDTLNVTTPPTNAGTGTAGADLNTATVASTGATAGTLATDIATAVAAAAANAFDQAGDTLVITVTGTSIGGVGAVYVVIEDGSNLTTYDAAEDTVIQLAGTSSTTLAVADFE